MERTHSVDREGELLDFENSIDQDDREAVLKNDFSWEVYARSLRCYFAVWIEGLNFNRQNRYNILVETERRDFCFFFPNHPGMRLEAAKILQERQEKTRQTQKEVRVALVGLWVAAIALLLNFFGTIGIYRTVGHLIKSLFH